MKTKVSQSGNSQAALLPKDIAFSKTAKKVNVIIQGQARAITLTEKTWSSWFDNKNITDDFMEERDPPLMQERENL